MTATASRRGKTAEDGSEPNPRRRQGSPAQRDRRDRILSAAVRLATQGGYDAVTMREVAEHADVALGTLYRYFPSKDHLLVSGLVHEFERARADLDRVTITGDDPASRMLFVLGRVTKMFHRYPRFTEAMTRAFTVADSSANAEVAEVARQMETMFAGAMDPSGEVTEEHAAIARVIGDVWLANLISWVTQRVTADEVTERLELTVHLLLDHEAPSQPKRRTPAPRQATRRARTA